MLATRLLGGDIADATRRRVQIATAAFSAGGIGQRVGFLVCLRALMRSLHSQMHFKCAACGGALKGSRIQAVLFRCGHAFDRACVRGVFFLLLFFSLFNSFPGARGCVICRRKRMNREASRKAPERVNEAELAAALAEGELAAAAANTATSSSSTSATLSAKRELDSDLYPASKDEYAARLADFVAQEQRRFLTIKALARQ